MTTALEGLVQDPDRVERLGKEAHAHAMRFYPWEHKAKKTLEIYEWLLGRRPEKPSFWATPSEHK
jgi:glycosyltransferase involved in cell wall biosynthesis